MMHWCDGEQSKIRMQDPRVKISKTKVRESGVESGNGKVSRADKKS